MRGLHARRLQGPDPLHGRPGGHPVLPRRTALLAGSAGVLAAAGGGVYLAARDKPEPPAPPSLDANKRLLWRNWSGIEHAYPAVRSAPKTEAEVAQALKTSTAPVRVVGAGHSFTGLVPTSGTLMTLDGLAGIERWEGDQPVVRAGMRLGALGPALAERGRAMANLPDINKQSLGGCLGTATHGTGATIKAVHGDVTALRLATATGELIDCDATQNADVFNAARVSLGALGVITQVRLATSANRRLHRKVFVEPFEETLAKAEERWTKHRNYEFYAVPFTDLVDQAWQQGLTEPDPRVDLSGKDVMRKLVILAREAGYDIEPGAVRMESLVPAGCEEGSVDHFFENGDELNDQMVQRLEAAREMGLVLRYVARFEANGKARVGVEAVRPEHPLAALLPCDNVFAIESRWYRDNPLVIRGPGAGRDVTAGAIQSDINRLAKLL